MIDLYQGAMQEQLENVVDESVDLLLTDPPYNISANGANPEWKDPVTGENKNSIHNQRFSESFEQDWDAVTHEQFVEQLTEWSNSWYPKLRKGGAFAVFISDQYISYLWKTMEAAGFEPKRVIVWKKPSAVPFNRKVNPVSGCEYILWGIKPGGTRTFNASALEHTMIERYARADKVSSILYRMIKDNTDKSIEQVFEDALAESVKVLNNRKRDNDLIHCVIPNTITYSGGTNKNKIHPTQKPVELLRYFVELLTKENDLVLDTFAGSGSTGKACEQAGRRCVLIERDPKMFDLMSRQFQKNI